MIKLVGVVTCPCVQSSCFFPVRKSNLGADYLFSVVEKFRMSSLSGKLGFHIVFVSPSNECHMCVLATVRYTCTLVPGSQTLKNE